MSTRNIETHSSSDDDQHNSDQYVGDDQSPLPFDESIEIKTNIYEWTAYVAAWMHVNDCMAGIPYQDDITITKQVLNQLASDLPELLKIGDITDDNEFSSFMKKFRLITDNHHLYSHEYLAKLIFSMFMYAHEMVRVETILILKRNGSTTEEVDFKRVRDVAEKINKRHNRNDIIYNIRANEQLFTE